MIKKVSVQRDVGEEAECCFVMVVVTGAGVARHVVIMKCGVNWASCSWSDFIMTTLLIFSFVPAFQLSPHILGGVCQEVSATEKTGLFSTRLFPVGKKALCLHLF